MMSVSETAAPKTGEPIASMKQFRAALSSFPRDVQRKVRLFWLKGWWATAIELAEREMKDRIDD